MFRDLNDVLRIERKYDELRWSTDRPFEKFTLDEINNYGRELIEIIKELSVILAGKNIPDIEKNEIRIVRKKLQDFQWHLIDEEQNRERGKRLTERLNLIQEVEPMHERAKARNFAINTPLKGSDFYKNIPAIYGPQPRYGGGK